MNRKLNAGVVMQELAEQEHRDLLKQVERLRRVTAETEKRLARARAVLAADVEAR